MIPDNITPMFAAMSRRKKGDPMPQKGEIWMFHHGTALPAKIQVSCKGPKKGGVRDWRVDLYSKRSRRRTQVGMVQAAGWVKAAEAYWASVRASKHAALPLAAALSDHLGEGWAEKRDDAARKNNEERRQYWAAFDAAEEAGLDVNDCLSGYEGPRSYAVLTEVIKKLLDNAAGSRRR
ncbi:MAG: hypothetical protein NZM07_03685 [Elioraea sp.]|nr:hypothetical protein [Elioraea sp.]